MALKDKASAKWSELKQKLQDKQNQKRVQEEVKRRLQQGREAIDRIEKELTDPANYEKAEAKLREAKAKLTKLKAEFKKRQAETVAYTKANPEKALVVAAAAGALAGAVWTALRRKK
ncbi:MAG TPA: hypothetical protein VMV05_06730 [bacterium]|nr:hypothetical protein [bacterium]